MKHAVDRVLSAPLSRRVAGGAFLFFTVKGILWLLAPLAAALWLAER